MNEIVKEKTKTLSLFMNIAKSIIGNIRGNLSDPIKVKCEIESLPIKCMDSIINEKLISDDNINKYDRLFCQYKKMNQEIPKDILFKDFPEVGLVYSLIMTELSSNKLNVL